MITKLICEDELYPSYWLYDKTGDVAVELTEDEWGDYQRVQKEWDAWQDRLSDLYTPN